MPRGKVPTTNSIKDIVLITFEKTPDIIYSSADMWEEIYNLWGALTAKSSIQRVLTELVNENKIIKTGSISRPRYHAKNTVPVRVWGIEND